jgi:hypothetical protein
MLNISHHFCAKIAYKDEQAFLPFVRLDAGSPRKYACWRADQLRGQMDLSAYTGQE